MKDLKISIITINYNNLIGLKKTYDSIKSQTAFTNYYEWIVIDGNSTDGTNKWFKDLSIECNYKYISEPDKGIYNAMNKGIDLCNGQYILFLNSGDIFYNKISLEYLNNIICKNFNYDLILFGFFYNNSKRYPKPLWWRFWSLPTSHQSILYRYDLLITNKYNEDYMFASDYDHFLKILKNKLLVLSDNFILIENEKFGSDKNFKTLKNEYKSIFIKYYFNKYLALLSVEFKFTYYSFLKLFN
jgi:glycosyltransferase involved in cell wall biosynthesis